MLGFGIASVLCFAPPALPAGAEAPGPVPPDGGFWLAGGATLGGSALFWGVPLAVVLSWRPQDARTGVTPSNPTGDVPPDVLRLRVGVGLQAAAFVLGGAAIAVGAVQDDRYGRWKREHPGDLPPSGGAMIGAAVGCFLSGGFFAGSVGPILLTGFREPLDPVIVYGGIGAYALTGTLLAVFGARRRRAFRTRVDVEGGGRRGLAIEPLAGPGSVRFGLYARPR